MAAQAPLTTLAMASSDDKNRIDHIDKAEDVVDDTAKAAPPAEGMLRKSHFDGMTRWRTIYVFRQSVFYTFLVYIGYMAEGFELNGGNSIVANRGFIQQFGTLPVTDGGSIYRLDPTWLSVWGAMLNVGQIVTFCYIGLVADRFGRIPCFYLSFTLTLSSLFVYNFGKTPAVWAVGKIFNGMAIGILQVIAQVNNIGGIIVSAMMQNLNKTRPNDYLTAMRILFVPVGIIILCWLWLPESPWHHARRGEKEKALKCMKRLYSKVEGYNPEDEYAIIVATIAYEREQLELAGRYREVFKGINARRTLTIILLSISSQLGGLGMIGTYSTYFFAIAGLADPFLGTLILSLCNLLMVTIWTFTCDRFGRRLFVCCAHLGVIACCFICGSLFYATAGGASATNQTTGIVLLFICCVWTMVWQIINKAYPLYSAELPAALLRVRTGPITFAANSVFGLATSFAIPPMLFNLNLRAGFVFGAFSVPCNIGLWYFLPETKDRSAGEIDELFNRRIPAWKWAKTQTEAQDNTQQARTTDNERTLQ